MVFRWIQMNHSVVRWLLHKPRLVFHILYPNFIGILLSLELEALCTRQSFLFTVGIWNLHKSGFQMVKNRLVCKYCRFWMDTEIQKPSHSKSRQLVAILSKNHFIKNHFIKNHLKSWQKWPDFEWSWFQMVGIIAIARPFENQTIWNPTIWNPLFKKSKFQMVGTGFQIFNSNI